MKYRNIHEGQFVDRPNRFIANVVVDDKIETVHVKNTGRCKEILLHGAKVYLDKSENPNRKTRFDLIGVEKRILDKEVLINIDSQIPNKVVEEGILNKKITELTDIHFLKPEVGMGKSRFDFYYETRESTGFIEVKGVTLEDNKIAKFPDAPTDRGSKHIKELTSLQKEGYKNYVFFLVQMNYPWEFRPNVLTDCI
ncbi:DNA/RNA nuclease SfsA [Alkalibacter mobilis]|uniref:DNA/RNA nuclease SfsA n=1 Tax=Alkalibacter mobilis TaxID=2787712 RepID=UPI00189D1528|nr:DNA/RNA nuclease SfsA [Alkalibacter mobilis]MBF7097386.1 DNA/RNA nuclease SfsA [Alkalibacter mobilis]